MTKHLIRLAKIRMHRQIVQHATALRFDAQARDRSRTREQTTVTVVECGPCGRRGHWAYPSTSAVPRYCDSACREEEIEAEEEVEAMAPYFAERAAKNAAQEAADNAHEWLQQQLAHEEEEKEERRVLSIEAMADEETMSTYDEVLFLVDGH